MKRKMLVLMIAATATLPVFVNADAVDSTKFNECVTATGSKICTLTENINLASTVEVNGNITLDLAGYQITSSVATAIKVNSGSLTVKDTSSDSKGKIEVSGEAFRVGTKGVTTDNKDSAILTIEKDVDVTSTNDSCVVIYAGTLNTSGNLVSTGGTFATVTGSGNDHGTLINVTGGTVNHKKDVALYHPQNGELNVSAGVIEGYTGIEIRAGKLNVTGGTIRGTYKPLEFDSNGNGTTTKGAGIAVAQHNTKLAIDVKVSGGVIEGYTALHEVTTESGITKEDIDKISITISGGTFNAINTGTNAIYSANKKIVINAGEFDGTVSEDLTQEDSNIYEVETPEGDTKYVVATEDDEELAPYENVSLSAKELKEALAELEKDNSEETQEFLKVVTKALEGKNVASAHDIYYGKFIGENLVKAENNLQPEEGKKVAVTIKIPTDLEKLKEGYTRKYSIIRFHKNDNNEVEVANLAAKENTDGTVTFETEKFSTYVLVYEDVKNTENPKTADNIIVYLLTTIISVFGLAFTGLKVKKNSMN